MRGSATACSALAVLWAMTSPALAQRSDDDEGALLIAEARAALAAQNYDKAAGALDRALLVDPRRLDAYLLRASVHAIKNEHARGVALLRRARTLAPENVEVLSALGAELVQSGEDSEGVPLLEAVVANAPNRYQAHATLGQYYASHDRLEKAIIELDAYLRTRPAALEGQDGAFQIALGDAELRSGHAADALRRFDGLVAAEPKNLRARLGSAWAAAAVDCRSAAERLASVLPLSDRFPDILLVIGRCDLKLGRHGQARERADRYLTLRPDAAGHALRGEALFAGGDSNGARRELALAIDTEPANPLHKLRVARIERLSGDPGKALARLAGPVPPGLEPGWSTEIAEAQLAAGRPQEAIATLRPVSARFAADTSAHATLGAALLETGALEAALVELEAATTHAQENKQARELYARALVATGVAAARAGRLPEAATALGRAVELDSNNADAQLDLGAVRLDQGDPQAALAPLENAAHSAKDATALFLYGRALAQLGRHKDALVAFEAAVPLWSNDSRTAELTIEMAATELDAGDPLHAVARLETLLGNRSFATGRGRVEEAYLVAARAAALRSITSGNLEAAVRLLERAERLATGRKQLLIELRCELALVATAAGDREIALARLRALGGVTCPFPRPADELAVPILIAANVDARPEHVEQALNRLDGLSRQATGPAAQLIADVTRAIAVRAAADAYARGHGDKARRFLSRATKVRGSSGAELAYNEALLELDAGHLDVAIAALERLASTLPEAQLALGVAFERRGEPMRALEAFERAQAQGVTFERLAEWIGAKKRIFGGGQ